VNGRAPDGEPEPAATALRAFYDRAYCDHPEADARRFGAWRQVSAVGKVERILRVLPALPGDGVALLDVGCGDGALLVELARRRPGWALTGAEISPQASLIAAGRLPSLIVRTYDGARLPWPDASFDVGVLSHVLEHVSDAPATLREVARVCRLVVFEVPLERNLSARRRSRRAQAARIGHVRRLGRGEVRAIVAQAALEPRAELTGTVSRDVLRFFADSPRARAAADAKWIVRMALQRVAPALAERLFTVHYVALCVTRAT
jgi:SAM-dependent methyltransferase